MKCAAIALLTFSLHSLSAAVYVAPDDLPTADEVAILELMNRFRADPVAETDRILAAQDVSGFLWKGVDKAMFASEMKALPKAPPLVFNIDVLRAARCHSYYMVHNGLGHVQIPGKEGFTGASFSERMTAAGFTGSPGGENCFAAADNPWQSHVAFLIDFGEGGTGGMQNGRGHRTNMANPGFNVVGPSAVPNGGKISVTHDFGSVNGRFAGGVLYNDKNGNGEFDSGEGCGDVEIRCGANHTKTWASGGYVLPIDNAAPAVVASFGKLVASEPVTSGSGNIHFSWSIPPGVALELCDKLVQAVEKIDVDKRATGRGLKVLVDLHQGTQRLNLDDSRRAKVVELTAPIAAEITANQQAMLAAIDANDAVRIKTATKDARKWNGTALQAWFDSAEQLLQATTGVRSFEASKAQGATGDQAKTGQLVKALKEAMSKAPSDLTGKFAALLSRVGR